jgi:hypothetical protein
MEDPTEEIQKHLHEQAHEAHDPSLMRIALSSALIAVLAAVASLLSEHQVNEALVSQLKASDQWAYYQAKGIKHNVLDTQVQILTALGKTDPKALEGMKAGVEKYKKDQDEIAKEATKEQDDSAKALRAHTNLSYSVTVLQVAIGLSAVAALTRRRWLWFGSMAVAVVGLGLLGWGTWLAFFV